MTMAVLRDRGRRGITTVWAVMALMTLVGTAAGVIDVGRLILGAQRAQDVADMAALACGRELPCEYDAYQAAEAVVQANNSEGIGFQVQCSYEDLDIVYYGPGETVPGYTQLGPWACAATVTVHAPVEFAFAAVLGIDGATATRSATVMRGVVKGAPITPIWIAGDTPLNYGQLQQLYLDDDPTSADIPGSFGFLQPPPGCTAEFFDLLQGYNLTLHDVETAFVSTGDTMYAETGEKVGLWGKALGSDGGLARLERGTTGKWADDTFTDYHYDNPRILLVPMVTYLGGTGSGAAFRIEKFGAVWLEEVNQGQKEIWGRFIEYSFPGGDPDEAATTESGVFATELVLVQ